MKVLVTGGAGFIGSHITKVLLEKGHVVTVLDDLSTGYKENVPSGVRFVQGSIQDDHKLDEALTDQEAVIHMAAFIIVPESVEKPMLYIHNNILGTAQLLEGMRRNQVKKIILSSSATVYGVVESLPIKEETPLSIPENTYGATKACMEMIAASYHKMYGLDVTLLRYFNPYGPGEEHDPETHVIPNLIRSALKKEPIPLYWQGQQIRDFVYVGDLAAAHVDVLKLSGLNTFNIGTEKGTKVKEVVDLIFKILGYRVPIKDLGQRLGDVAANYASSEKLELATGWKAEVSLEDGLRKTIDYYQNHNEG